MRLSATLVSLSVMFLSTAGCSAAPKIAIFDQPEFPYYMADSADSPRLFADLCESIGLEASRLSVAELSDPSVMNTDNFAAYLHVYGNTFPLEAFETLVEFHSEGGCLICVSGVPFCHPVVSRGAAGWSMEVSGRGGRILSASHSGRAALRIHNRRGGDWTGPASKRFAVAPGEKFTVGGWVKVAESIEEHAKSRIYLRFYDAAGTFIGQDGPQMPHDATQWRKVQADVEVPQGAATADVSPQLWASGGELLIDDLFLYRHDQPGTNRLSNASFEEVGGGWVDLGHDSQYLTHSSGIGTGAFSDKRDPGAFRVTEHGKAIGLDALRWDLLPAPSFCQTLDPSSLPAEDEVIPLVAAGDPDDGTYPAAMIVHNCRKFRGAIDVWGRGHCSNLRSHALYHVVLKSLLAALERKGDITETEAKAMTDKVDDIVGTGPKAYEPVAENRPFDTPWPRSDHPADTVFVCDASQAGPQQEFALTVLQGLVNRQQPRLYILHSRYSQQDAQWLEELGFEGLETEQITIDDVWETFGDVPQGVVVYDGSIMDEIGAYHADRLNLTNVILMLCSLHNAVPQAAEPGVDVITEWPVAFDTRDKWEAPYEMYQWAYDNLWEDMNHHILATLYPGIFYLTDYLVEHRIFTFWFSSQRTVREQQLLEGILASTPPNTPIIGWWFCWMPNVQDPAHRSADCVGEGEGVRLGSRFGKFLTPSHECTNLSVHSGMPVLDYEHKPPARKVQLQDSKVYYSFIISDGDNLGECLMMRRRESRWDVPQRGDIPIGWSCAPAGAHLAPPVLNYYLRTATPNDYLVGGLGIAYTNPDYYATAYPDHRDDIFAGYAEMTAESLKPLDTGSLWLIGGSRENVSRYAQAGRPLRAIFADYGTGQKRPYEQVTYMDANDVAVFRAVTGWGGDEEYEDRLVREITQATDGVRPAFLHVFILNWGANLPLLQRVRERLGDEYICVRPDQLYELFAESQQ